MSSAGRRSTSHHSRNGQGVIPLLMTLIIMTFMVVGGWMYFSNEGGALTEKVVSVLHGETQARHDEKGRDKEGQTKQEESSLLKKMTTKVSQEMQKVKEKVQTKKTKAISSDETAAKVEENASKPVATIPPISKGKARLAIVLDDFGYNRDIIERFNAMAIPLTYAVIPYKEYSTTAAELGYEAGKEIMIHLPMESISHENAEAITINTSMTAEQIRGITNNAVAAIPHAVGMNNHQGSQATADRNVMRVVLQEMKKHGLFYVDSRTNSASVGVSTARALGVPTGANELFLDNDSDVGAIENRLAQAGRIALQSSEGYAIVIGHARPNTATALRTMIPRLQAQGIEFVFVRQLLY